MPFLTIVLRREFHLDERQVGWLLLAYGAGSLTSILVGGALTDRLGRRFTLLLSLVRQRRGRARPRLRGLDPHLRAAARAVRLHGRPLPAGGVVDHRRRAAVVAAGVGLRRPAPGHQPRVRGRDDRWAASWPTGTGGCCSSATASPPWPTARSCTCSSGRRGRRPPRAATRGRPPGTSPWRDAVFLQLLAVSFAFAMIFFNHISTLPLTVTGRRRLSGQRVRRPGGGERPAHRALRDGDGRAAAALPAAARGRGGDAAGRPRLRRSPAWSCTGAGSC